MKRITIAVLALFTIAFTIPAHADILSPSRHIHRNTNLTITATASDAITTPTDPISFVSAITDKLGAKEGFGIDRHGVVNYAATTLYTFQQFPVGLNVGVINGDGVAETADINIGSLLPAANDPLTTVFDYAWAGGGLDQRDLNGSWGTSWIAEAQIKFSFN